MERGTVFSGTAVDEVIKILAFTQNVRLDLVSCFTTHAKKGSFPSSAGLPSNAKFSFVSGVARAIAYLY